MAKKLLEHFMKKNCKKANQKEFRIENVIKEKGNKLYVKWKRYDNSLNSWIDKKDVIQKWENIFLNYMNLLEETLMLKLIYLIMWEKKTKKKNF